MMIDLHNHTTRCNHAIGSVEAYVEQAIAQKIDVFGFSDHAPMHYDEAYRMHFNEMDAYEHDILHVKEQYKNEISNI